MSTRDVAAKIIDLLIELMDAKRNFMQECVDRRGEKGTITIKSHNRLDDIERELENLASAVDFKEIALRLREGD